MKHKCLRKGIITLCLLLCFSITSPLFFAAPLTAYAAEAEIKLNVKAIVLYTSTGKTASMLSRFKPNCPIIAITDDINTYNFLSLEWNVFPIYSKINDIDIFDLACTIAKEENMAQSGDKIIVTTGNTDKVSNVMKVCIID